MKNYKIYDVSGNVLVEGRAKTFANFVKNKKANLRGADLQGADLRGANLRWADLREADLRGADLQEANLRGADLRWADLREADLRGANLRGANLRWADLRGADLDFSCFPLWCGSFNMKVDENEVYRLLYHVCRLDCDSENVKEIQKYLTEFANNAEVRKRHNLPEA